MKYDIIGDIHGRADKLAEILKVLDYVCDDECYKHPKRKVIFLGDFIDGKVADKSDQKGVLNIVRPMVKNGSALAVMGNHELNAICFATKTKCNSKYLREHSQGKKDQHALFLKEYDLGTAEHDDVIKWFKTLPVYLEIGNLFIIHACPSMDDLKVVQKYLNVDNTLTEGAYHAYGQKSDMELHDALECILKGLEHKLPEGVVFKDAYKEYRSEARVKWWVCDSKDKASRIMTGSHILPDADVKKINESGKEIPKLNLPEKHCFVGHYWMTDEPSILADNFACVDYSVGREGGQLACYRYSGESTLYSSKFVMVKG